MHNIATETHSQIELNAKRLCRQTLRNYDKPEAFATLAAALGELLDDNETRASLNGDPAASAQLEALIQQLAAVTGEDHRWQCDSNVA